MTEPPKRPRSYLKWVFLGCGGLVALILLAVGGFFFLVLNIIKSSDSYEQSEAFIRSNDLVREHLGEVEKFGFLPSGHQNIHNGRGTAGWEVSVDGAKVDGVVVLTWSKPPDGEWKLEEAYLQLNGQELRLDVLGTWGPIRHRVTNSSSDWDD